jgi:hypothetical protein
MHYNKLITKKLLNCKRRKDLLSILYYNSLVTWDYYYNKYQDGKTLKKLELKGFYYFA